MRGSRSSAERIDPALADIETRPYAALMKARRFDEALPLLRTAMKRDDPQAMCAYAALLSSGTETLRRDPHEASLWFRQAAVRGDVFARHCLGLCLIAGTGGRKDRFEAAYWLYQAAAAGYLPSFTTLVDLAKDAPDVVGVHFSEEAFEAMEEVVACLRGSVNGKLERG